jgi:hypothetical protein
MAVFNLATKYETKLDERFTQGSLTDPWCGKDYNFDGSNSIKVWTLDQATINDYTTSPGTGVSRFGAIEEVGDSVATYTLAKKKSFNTSFDETNVQDQMFIKKANAYLKQVWDEQFVPMIDEDRFSAWANGAGQGNVNSTALTKSTIVVALLGAHAALNNKRVPRRNRVTFVTESMAINTKLATELAGNDAWTTKAVVNGQIAELNGFPVVSVPDDMMPSGIEFMVKYKNATLDPMKLKMLRVITNSENVAGSLMQGLVRFDSFVLAQKANGIYVYSNSGVCATPEFSISSNAVTITCGTSSATIKYTTDGSNPKTSSTAATYSAAVDITKDTKFRAYASKSGMVNSAIAEYNAVHS